MQHIDTLIHARWIIPVEPEGKVLENHAIAVQKGAIVSILPSREAGERYLPDITHSLAGHVLIPGLVNAHTHAAMTLFRGIADDLPLMDWLHNHIWPAETRWVDADFVYDGSLLAAAEMLRGGTTCFNDMYFYPDQAARAAIDAGIRAMVGLIVVDFPTAWARDGDEYFARGVAVHDKYRHEPLISTAFSPHAPYSVSDAGLARVQLLAEELDIPIHMHVHETQDELAHSQAQYRMRPIARLARLGLLSPRLAAVHVTHVEEEEIARLAAHGVRAVHCPESNLKLASGFCPVERLLAAGVTVGIGTDGCASNDDLDMFGEMRAAALLAKGLAGSARALPAARALGMATLGGARALGLDTSLGSLVPGKAADVVAVDLDTVETQPVYNPIAQLVYSASRHQVTHVWVAGNQVLKDRVLTGLDEGALLAKAGEWRKKISGESSQ